ncbi:ras GTPase activator [Blumeria hordei DH14]|uniref:Ras GTPase activator n=1 Tax=Blumeria graminis f. sp. hordei (strain DH14) TaxID=546991 RepID=N1J4S7_BLUG1|nr:ras GTPase activator [Blumeria hordei DH14]
MPDTLKIMSGDSSLVVTLLDRLTARLPHRTGSSLHEFSREEVVILTRATLVSISASSIGVVINTLVQVLEDLSKSYHKIQSHPIHVVHSELYVLELLAECCTVHWASMNPPDSCDSGSKEIETLEIKSSSKLPAASLQNIRKKAYRATPTSKRHPPCSLGDDLVRRLLNIVKIFSRPNPDGLTLPAENILDENLHVHVDMYGTECKISSYDNLNDVDVTKLLQESESAVQAYMRDILEYASFFNWPCALEYFKNALQQAAYHASSSILPAGSAVEEEKNIIDSMRLASSYWVDSRKLSIMIQETCGIFLHLPKSFQISLAIMLPLLISRWLENNPEEFVDLHERHQRLDGGAETLFDMTNTTFDGNRRKIYLHPFQTSLIFLLPEVFEVASNMRELKSGSISKKVSFLETLRKSLRNKNENAIYCLTCILRVARHFPVNSDAALLSFALDVQEEVREAVFKRYINIDNTLMTATFITLAHLNFEDCLENLVPLCLVVNAPPEFKVVVLSACWHFSKLLNAEDYQPLFIRASGFIRTQLKYFVTRKTDVSYEEQTKAGKSTDGNLSMDIVYNIMRFLNTSPLTLFIDSPPMGPEWRSHFEEIFNLFTPFLVSEDERIRNFAHAISLKLMGDGTRSIWKRSKGFGTEMLRCNFWKSSRRPCNLLHIHIKTKAKKANTFGTRSLVLITESEQLESRCDKKAGLAFIHGYLETRLALLKSVKELLQITEDVPERVAATTKLETVLLVCLCSPDISVCQLGTKCISLFCEETRLVDEAAWQSKRLLPKLNNLDIFTEISTRDFRFTGLVAFQKRVRGLLRQIQQPTSGILRAWEIAFDSWLKISKQIFSEIPESMEENILVEWRNYSGFLASLGGACISDLASTSDDVNLAGLNWIDKPLRDTNNAALLTRYMEQSVRLLSSNNVRIRETTRESLSTELASSLYLPLFHTLESELCVLFDNSRANQILTAESRVIFAEQAAATLKSIVDRMGVPSENNGALSIDVGVLTLNFAKFLDNLSHGAGVSRVKIKICQLCETITQKEELLNLRHDVRIRNQLLEVIFNWITRPSSPKEPPMGGSIRADDALRLQRDLNKASLKALADLTYRLPLQPADGQTDADISDLKSQMFHTYFNRFLSLLSYDFTEKGKNDLRLATVISGDSTAIPELIISALSNLLSANIDIGLKYSLGIGYHENLGIRTAFVKVLCNLLIQGTEFNNLSDASMNEKYDELLKLLLGDVASTIALCDACPSTEVDEMTISILNIFDSRGLGFDLLEALIEHEVDETENEAELLRRNCVTTKMLSIYSRWKGATYLKVTLQKVLKRLVLTSQDLDFELDPARTTSVEELQKNALQLRIVAKISSAVMRRFPEAKFTAVGAFIFLRFFCPAIVAPDSEGLIDSPPSKEMRRGLLLIAKVIQNLANNVLFGAKESYMYPLNDFLTQNIYRVTTFLREISVPSNVKEISLDSEPFDFGACVALHRFLYENWDHVRQKIVLQERKRTTCSPAEINKEKVPILQILRKLIANLGPPPMDVSWNRPGISLNTPPSYSRFQHFMLQNAGRNTEFIETNRAIYDGGESKDGLPIICIILRNIDAENIDYDLLLFGYLKIASRMWHRNFGILVDATCYNGQNEPQDKLFQKLNLLTPSELLKHLSRMYVYNMNSVFRKCFRRILRLSAKTENCAFHPKNIKYHLISNLQDLQVYFHLSQLHLPKETISVVTDTRYVFQPITRLSRTRGKIEVVIKVGSQFVQVTTINKQDIVPGLRLQANLNDIFPLSEIDEASTSIQTDDDSAFGLRTENGKIAMYFVSPRKHEILQAIKGTKGKQGKELRRSKSFERLLRPQDVPGTLLNIALMNMSSTDEVLRLASYNLLGALCRAFKFSPSSNFISAKDLCVPINPSHFIVSISQRLAQSEPQLTADFLTEFFVGWGSFPNSQRPLSLAYMAPWLHGLRSSLIPCDSDGDKTRDKVASIFRKLIDIAMSDLTLSTTLEQCVWPALSQDEIYVDIFLDEIAKIALGFGSEDGRTEILASIISSFDTITVRGKLLSRLRKALGRSSLRPTRNLPDNSVWPEICVLLRFCLSTSFDSGVQSQLYLPELFHIITMLANTGSADFRSTVHRLLINTIHAMCSAFELEESKLVRLRALLLSLSEPQSSSLFNISPRDSVSVAASQEFGISTLLATESLAVLLAEVSTIAAPSIDMSNAWRSRWMSLVASTAFQNNPSIQPRAFTVIGCLARENVDDDFLYQVLVALRSSIFRFVEDNECEMLIAIVTALTKMIDKLPSSSRYGLQFFWLALSLVRLVPLALFNYIAPFLDAALSNISSTGKLKGGRMVTTLLQGRMLLGDTALQLDNLYGIHFNLENFHFAVCASLVKGLSDSVTRAAAIRVLQTFLEVTSSSMVDETKALKDQACMPYLGLLISRAMTSDEMKESLWLAGYSMPGEDYNHVEITDFIDFDTMKDKELLLNASIGIVDFNYLENAVRNRCLIWLKKIAMKRPAVILYLCGRVTRILDDILISCQNAATLESAHQLLRCLTSNAKFNSVDTTEMLQEVLDGIGFGGLWRSSTFHIANENGRQCTALTDRLIELIIA